MNAASVKNNIRQLLSSLKNIISGNGNDNVLCFPIPKTEWGSPSLFPNNGCDYDNNGDLKYLLIDFITVIEDYYDLNKPDPLTFIFITVGTDQFVQLKNRVGEDLALYLHPKILAVLYNGSNKYVNINCYLNYPFNVKMEYITDKAHRPPYIPGSGFTYPAGSLSKDVNSYYNNYNYSCMDHDTIYNIKQQVALTVNGLLNTGLPPPIPSFSGETVRWNSSTSHRFSKQYKERTFIGVL